MMTTTYPLTEERIQAELKEFLAEKEALFDLYPSHVKAEYTPGSRMFVVRAERIKRECAKLYEALSLPPALRLENEARSLLMMLTSPMFKDEPDDEDVKGYLAEILIYLNADEHDKAFETLKRYNDKVFGYAPLFDCLDLSTKYWIDTVVS